METPKDTPENLGAPDDAAAALPEIWRPGQGLRLRSLVRGRIAERKAAEKQRDAAAAEIGGATMSAADRRTFDATRPGKPVRARQPAPARGSRKKLVPMSDLPHRPKEGFWWERQ